MRSHLILGAIFFSFVLTGCQPKSEHNADSAAGATHGKNGLDWELDVTDIPESLSFTVQNNGLDNQYYYFLSRRLRRDAMWAFDDGNDAFATPQSRLEFTQKSVLNGRIKLSDLGLSFQEKGVLNFTDGGFAISLSHFASHPGQYSPQHDATQPHFGSISIVSEIPTSFIYRGDYGDLPLVIDRIDPSEYIYFGEGTITRRPSFTAIIDTAFPKDYLRKADDDLERAFKSVADAFGAKLSMKPMVYLAYNPEARAIHYHSGIATSQSFTAIQLGGAFFNYGWMKDYEAIYSVYLHEIVHLHQKQIGLDHVASNAKWVVEGGAEAASQALLSQSEWSNLNIVAQANRHNLEICVKALSPNDDPLNAIDPMPQATFDLIYDYGCGALLIQIGAKIHGEDIFAYMLRLARISETERSLNVNDIAMLALDAAPDNVLAQLYADFIRFDIDDMAGGMTQLVTLSQIDMVPF